MMTKSPSSNGDSRRAHFARRYLEQAPKVALALRRWMPTGAEEASDIMQDLFIRLIEQIDASKEGLEIEALSDQQLRYYIVQSVRNRWIDNWRREEIVKRNYEEVERVLADTSTPETLLAEHERREHLHNSITALRAPYRELLQSLLDEDVTLAELARRKNIKIGTIYAQFSRALQQLRSEWNRRNHDNASMGQ